MTFNVSTFKDTIIDAARPNLFKVFLDDNEKLSFFVHYIDVCDDKVVLSLYENTEGYVAQTLTALRKKINHARVSITAPLKIQMFNAKGELFYTHTYEVYHVGPLSFILSWADNDNTMRYDVTLFV